MSNSRYDPDTTRMIILFCLMGLGIVCSIFVITVLLKFGTMKSSFTYLLFFIEISLIGEQITALPFVFTGNDGLCTSIAFFASYFGMMNVVLVGLLITAHRLTLFNNTLRFRKRIVKYGPEISLIFPLITLIPFARNIYQHHHLPWCLSKPHEEVAWMIVVFYGWIGLLLLISFLNIFSVLVRVCIVAPDMIGRFFSSIGLCSFASIFSWIPRFLILVSGRTNMIGVVGPIYIQSILIAIIFFFDRKSLETNERHYSTNAPINFRESNSSAFSWEVGELLEELSLAGVLDLESIGSTGTEIGSHRHSSYIDDLSTTGSSVITTENMLHHNNRNNRIDSSNKHTNDTEEDEDGK